MVASYKPYASALFEIAQEQGKEQAYLDELRNLEQIWKSNADFALALSHPKSAKAEKREWLRQVFASGVDPVVLNFLYVLNEHGIAAHVPEIADEYADLYRKSEQIEEVHVQSATALSEAQIEALSKMLKEKLNKNVELTVDVDPDLIAGLKVKAKDIVLDNTVKTRLDNLKEKLNEK